MRRQITLICLILGLLFSCKQQKTDLNKAKQQFIHQISLADTEEGPFQFSYNCRTVYFSKELISLFGELFVYDRLPHGWKQYEGKIFWKKNGRFKEVQFVDIFRTEEEREFVRLFCENHLKDEPASYFSGDSPLYNRLALDKLETFVVDDQYIIMIFQPYSVGGESDGPIVIKIPLSHFKEQWNTTHPLHSLLLDDIAPNTFISSWDPY